ncbi:MAG: fumarylacetoacetate hydrolase family protein [Chloroflexi bacterium]|nr:fumarylacetoacetate hydrolase family protein [Chloroflexota bacterium]
MAKIARFARGRDIRYGLVLDENTLRIIQGDIFSTWWPTEQTVRLQDVRLLPPVDPPNIIAIGLNYRAHAQESGAALPSVPAIFIKATTALCAPGAPIVLPRVAPNHVDYECELAIVIGRRAKHVRPEEAHAYVLGYTCANDVSARDCQRSDAQWARAKSFDTFAPLGPWIQTDLDPDNAPIRTRLNGQIMQDSNTNDLIFKTSELISFVSDAMTLLPGTVILTGTPSGVGFARKPPVFLRPGDVIEIEIDGIGTLRNPVMAEE